MLGKLAIGFDFNVRSWHRADRKQDHQLGHKSKDLNYDLTDTCIDENVAARSITPYCLKIIPFSVCCIQINNDQEA